MNDQSIGGGSVTPELETELRDWLRQTTPVSGVDEKTGEALSGVEYSRPLLNPPMMDAIFKLFRDGGAPIPYRLGKGRAVLEVAGQECIVEVTSDELWFGTRAADTLRHQRLRAEDRARLEGFASRPRRRPQ